MAAVPHLAPFEKSMCAVENDSHLDVADDIVGGRAASYRHKRGAVGLLAVTNRLTRRTS